MKEAMKEFNRGFKRAIASALGCIGAAMVSCANRMYESCGDHPDFGKTMTEIAKL